MTTTTPKPAPGVVVPVADPLFTVAERQALAGFLSGYSGLTRDAYTLDLRQYTAWCTSHGLHLFAAKRVDIETFRGDMETAGKARATIARRLCTIAGFYRYAVEEELLEHSPAAMSAARAWTMNPTPPGWTATNSARYWSLPGWASPPSTRWSRSWLSTACGSPKPPAPTSRTWVSSAGTEPW
jgi:hypothetical protein